MTVETPVLEDAPVIVAWNAYKATDGFANTRRWAKDTSEVDGSLWTAFYNGFFAAAVNSAGPASAADEEIKRLRAALAAAPATIIPAFVFDGLAEALRNGAALDMKQRVALSVLVKNAAEARATLHPAPTLKEEEHSAYGLEEHKGPGPGPAGDWEP